MTKRMCITCNEEKSLEEFAKASLKRTNNLNQGYYNRCKSCSYRSKKLWEQKNRDKVQAGQDRYKEKWDKSIRTCFNCKDTKFGIDFSRGSKLCKKCFAIKCSREQYRRYGLTEESFNLLIERQGGENCAICGFIPQKGDRVLNIDHDHNCCSTTTGKCCGKCVRGLLCNSCNFALGKMKDSAENLMRAAAYLIQYELPISEYSSQKESLSNV